MKRLNNETRHDEVTEMPDADFRRICPDPGFIMSDSMSGRWIAGGLIARIVSGVILVLSKDK